MPHGIGAKGLHIYCTHSDALLCAIKPLTPRVTVGGAGGPCCGD